MSSEQLGSGENVLKGNLGGAWDIKHGYADAYTDLGIARRFGGAAAAYSLRDIGAMNGEVVRVRREPHDTTASIDDEISFSANQVKSGALEDWVNGKLEDALPADVATAAAAYSLRKVKESYANNSVRIRRSSDDAEVNVAFDTNDKVSTSSSISVVSGSTTATDLNGFLNETLTVGTAINGTGSFPYGSFTANGNTGFSADNTGGSTASAGFPYTFANGDVMIVTYTVSNFTSDSGLSPGIRGTNSASSVTTVAGGADTFTANGTYTDTLTATADGTHLMFADGNTGSYTISDFQIVSHTHQAFVHTWYDQAGSNNLTQDTADHQPKIAENGALLSQGIQYDGSVDRLSTASGFTYAATDSLSFFIAGKNEGADNRQTYLGQGDGTGTGKTWLRTNETNNQYLTSFGASDNDFGDKIQDGNYVLSFIYDEASSTIDLFQQAVQSGSQATSVTNTAASGSLFLGCNKSESNRYEGSFKEVIVYLSDQTTNRFKIESNINNYYGLYNDELELTEDFEGGSVSSSSVGGQTFVGNGKDGFTVTTSSSASGEGGFTTLANVLAYKISFNAKLNGNSLNISRRINKHSSGAATQLQAITEGFNTYDFLTDGGGSYQSLTFTTSDNNATITISDFKISAIARNGFVETWYDQSDTGNDATQGTATNQPSIVQNGGLVKVNNKPAISFDGSDNYLILDTEVKFNSTASDKVNSIFNVALIVAGNRSYLGLGSGNKNWFGVPYLSNYYYRDNNGNELNTADAVPLNQQISFTFVSDASNDIETYQNGSSIHSANSVFDTHLRIKNFGRSYNSANYQTMSSQELIMFADDKTSEIADLHNEINNHYNIY